MLSAAALPLYQQRSVERQQRWLGGMVPRLLLTGLAVSVILLLSAGGRVR
ncbi:virulence factor MVIN-like protein, partial [Pseudomonas syringae pv. pisi str. 1704B]